MSVFLNIRLRTLSYSDSPWSSQLLGHRQKDVRTGCWNLTSIYLLFVTFISPVTTLWLVHVNQDWLSYRPDCGGNWYTRVFKRKARVLFSFFLAVSLIASAEADWNNQNWISVFMAALLASHGESTTMLTEKICFSYRIYRICPAQAKFNKVAFELFLLIFFLDILISLSNIHACLILEQ